MTDDNQPSSDPAKESLVKLIALYDAGDPGMQCVTPDVIAQARAALAAPALPPAERPETGGGEQQYTIKPLVWRVKPEMTGVVHVAETILGTYVWHPGSGRWLCTSGGRGTTESPALAKSSAETYYRARLASALAPVPARTSADAQTIAELKAVVELARTVRTIERQRDDDEAEFCAAGQTYGIDQLEKARADLDAALAAKTPNTER